MCFGRAESIEAREPADDAGCGGSNVVRAECLRIETGGIAVAVRLPLPDALVPEDRVDAEDGGLGPILCAPGNPGEGGGGCWGGDIALGNLERSGEGGDAPTRLEARDPELGARVEPGKLELYGLLGMSGTIKVDELRPSGEKLSPYGR